MTPELLQILVPIVAILSVFGAPVVLVYVWKFFKLKEKELLVDAEVRKSSGQALEQRVQRLESIIMALDADLRAKLGVAEPHRQLMEGPATQGSGQPGEVVELPAKVR